MHVREHASGAAFSGIHPMAKRSFNPSVTVAAIVEREGRYLLIEENVLGRRVLNQPAGHWEKGETLTQACVRETLEEAACEVTPTALVGIYQRHDAAEGKTYLRLAFSARFEAEHPGRPLDKGIVRTWWLTPEELRQRAGEHRSPLVMQCVEDHLAGRRVPLDLLQDAGL